MDQTLHNRDLGNGSLSDHITQSLSSASSFSLLTLPKNPFPVGSKPSPGGTWEEVSSKLGSKAAQLIHRAERPRPEAHRASSTETKAPQREQTSGSFSASRLPSSEGTEGRSCRSDAAVRVCSQQYTECKPLLLFYVLCMTHLTHYQVAQALELLVPPCLMLGTPLPPRSTIRTEVSLGWRGCERAMPQRRKRTRG